MNSASAQDIARGRSRRRGWARGATVVAARATGEPVALFYDGLAGPSVDHADSPGAGRVLGVRRSRDGVLVAFDQRLVGVGGQARAIEEIEWAALEVSSVRPLRVRRVEDVVAAWPAERPLALRLFGRSTAIVDGALRLLGDRSSSLLLAEDPELLRAARAAGSGHRHLVVIGRESPAYIHLGGGPGCDGVVLERCMAGPRTIARHARGGVVAVSDVRPQELREAASIGAEMIFLCAL